MDKEKSSGILLNILMVILVLLMCGSFVGMFFMMKEAEGLREEINNLKDNKNEAEESKNATSAKCKSVVGTYYAEVIEGNLHMKQTYSFSADGSYVNYVENSEGISGTYSLIDGVINFKQKPVYGPVYEYIEYSYTVSNDCKTIYVKDDTLSYELKLVNQ